MISDIFLDYYLRLFLDLFETETFPSLTWVNTLNKTKIIYTAVSLGAKQALSFLQFWLTL